MSAAEKAFFYQASLGRLGVDASLAVARARERSQSRMGRKRTRSQVPGVSDMDIDAPEGSQPPEKRVHSAKSRWGPPKKDRVSEVGAEKLSAPIVYGPSRILSASFSARGMHGKLIDMQWMCIWLSSPKIGMRHRHRQDWVCSHCLWCFPFCFVLQFSDRGGISQHRIRARH